MKTKEIEVTSIVTTTIKRTYRMTVLVEETLDDIKALVEAGNAIDTNIVNEDEGQVSQKVISVVDLSAPDRKAIVR